MPDQKQRTLRLADPSRPPRYDKPTALQFTAEEKRELFKGMVVSSLESGFLRYSSRQSLMKYAGILGIREFEASLLIAEAQFGTNDIAPVAFDSVANLDRLARPDTWSVSLRLTFALAAAIVIDLVVVRLMFG